MLSGCENTDQDYGFRNCHNKARVVLYEALKKRQSSGATNAYSNLGSAKKLAQVEYVSKTLPTKCCCC
jgi:hypothetical protein